MPRGRSQKKPSLSARRVWIEIRWLLPADRRKHVALRKESVDRNCREEMDAHHRRGALRKESVDRNLQAAALPLM